MSFCARVERDTSCISRRRPNHCAKPATLEKFWLHMTKLWVIKRGEALNPRSLVVYCGFEYRNVQDPNLRGSALKPTAKYVDECLHLVHLQNATPVVTPLTEEKSDNLHDETSVCDQAEHALFRAVVGKLSTWLE